MFLNCYPMSFSLNSYDLIVCNTEEGRNVVIVECLKWNLKFMKGNFIITFGFLKEDSATLGIQTPQRTVRFHERTSAFLGSYLTLKPQNNI
jgi:hypothetical protein